LFPQGIEVRIKVRKAITGHFNAGGNPGFPGQEKGSPRGRLKKLEGGFKRQGWFVGCPRLW